MHIRLKAYEPDGTSLGLLPRPLGVDADFQHNDAGTLKVTYSRLAVGGGILKRGLEQGLAVGFEVSDGGAWMEPYNARFVLVSRSRDAKDRSDTVTLNLMTYAWLLKKALLIDTSKLLADGDNKGKRPFYSANPGVILRTMLDENRERGGVGRYVDCGFDTGKDSAGAAWSNIMTLYYDPGVDAYTALSNLAANGVCDWRTQGMTLNLWNADSSALCRDLSESIVIPMSTQALESPEEETIEDLASHILVRGDGIDFTQDNEASPTPWGKWELYSSQGGVSDEGTARLLMQSQLDQAARVRGQYTRNVLVTGVDALPLIDYTVGDWITAPTVSHGEKVRVQRVTISLSNQGLKAALILNDRLYDAQTRQAKRIQGITGGAVAGGAQGGRPAPTQDHRIPKTVEGLVVTTDAYIDNQGDAAGVAYAAWAEVTHATDNTSIDIEHYEVEWRYTDTGNVEDWRFAGLSDTETLSWGGLSCGRTIQVRVRAIPTYSDRKGEWCNPADATVESDVTPPSVPSKPIVVSHLGVVDVTSDGHNAANGGFEPDTAHLEIGRSTIDGGYTPISRIQPGGSWTDYTVERDTTYWYAMRATDRSGNTSDWSQGTSALVAPFVKPEEMDDLKQDMTDALADMDKTIAQAATDAQTAKTTAENAQTAADKLADDLTDVTTTVNGVQTDLDELTTTVEATATDASGALAAATEAKQTASEVRTTAERAYEDAQSALSQSSQAVQTATSVSTTLKSDYLSKQDASATYATQSQLTQTSNRLTASITETAATAEAAQEKALQVEATASGLSTTLSQVSTVANTAKTDAAKAQSTADGAVTQITAVKATVDGVKTEVSKAQSTADSAVKAASAAQQTVDGFKTTVASTYLTKSDASSTYQTKSGMSAYATTSSVNQTASSIKSEVAATYATKTSVNTLPKGDNLWPNQWFETGRPIIGRIASGVTPPYGGSACELFGRDFHNDVTAIPVTEGHTYRITVDAKRYKGDLQLNGGIWYLNRTTGNSWDSYRSPTTSTELSDGWARYTYDVKCLSGKQTACVFFQIDQALDGAEPTTGWYVSNLLFQDVTDEVALYAAIDESAEQTTVSLSSSIEQAMDEISLNVAESYYSTADAQELMALMETRFSQSSSDFTFKFNEIKTLVDGMSDDMNGQFADLSKYIRFVDGHIIIGVSGNPFSLDIGNDRISFMQNNSEIAYMSNHQLYISAGVITNNLQIGRFEFRPRANGNLSLGLKQ